ncbi:MAG: VWA domain-containing protein [Vicinamibacterales bacterium]|nr:VWA domain-containing protein [Vicinamibacterales bacterium]
MSTIGRHVVGVVAALVAAWAVVAAGQAPQPPAAPLPDPGILFTSPEDGAFASGPMTLSVRLDPPDTPVRNVSLFADGRLVCTLERAPFECPWDAGPKVNEHLLRAVVVTADGRRLARAIRTKGVAYAEAVDVDVVHITATITDKDGNFARGLPGTAFRVFEDDVRQTITHFAAENIPLEIIVAVDVSGSMTDAMGHVKSAVKTFLSALRPNDRVTVIGFNDNVFTLARPSADLATRLRAIDRLAPWGGTALYDVIVQAIGQLGRQTGRRVLVVFTDGEDLNSHIPLETAVSRIESNDAVLYPIGQGRATEVKSLKVVLDELARKSGGRAFFEDIAKLNDVFARILDELSNQYLLGYVSTNPAHDGKWRTIRVEAPGKDLQIRARQGYRVGKRAGIRD